MKVDKKRAKESAKKEEIDSMLGSILGGAAEGEPLQEQAAAQGEEEGEGSDVVQMYMSAPDDVRNRVRAEIGAKDDDDAVDMLKNSPDAASIALEILKKRKEPASLIEGVPETAPQDIMYPKGGV